jgi:hypothetical protein
MHAEVKGCLAREWIVLRPRAQDAEKPKVTGRQGWLSLVGFSSDSPW